MDHRIQSPLDSRLALCASFVREGTRLADIGTDHAYLPVYLALEGRIRSAVAGDIRTGPLENARSNILRYGAQNIVTTVLSDGLDNIDPDSAYDIVMAGMGGELIADIIKRTQWLYDKSRRLILQPMTRGGTLRLFLCSHGFNILEEKACVCGRKCYSVMLCEYDGIIRPCDKRYEYIGTLGDDPSEEARKYVAVVKQKLTRKINGLLRSGKQEEAEEYRTIYRLIDERT